MIGVLTLNTEDPGWITGAFFGGRCVPIGGTKMCRSRG